MTSESTIVISQNYLDIECMDINKKYLVDLLLVVSVHAGEGEGCGPGEGEDGQTVHDGAHVGQQVHRHRELEQRCVMGCDRRSD